MNSAVAAGSGSDSPTNGQISHGEPHGSEPWREDYEAHLRTWSEGFGAAWEYLAPKLARAEHAADQWYLRANYSPEQIREMQLAAMDEGWREYWDAGMPTEAVSADV